MAAVIDFSKFEFCGRVVESVSELIMDDTLRGPAFESIHTIVPNIVTETQTGYIGEGGPVGVANQGCNPTPQEWNVATRAITWTPHAWEILLALCWRDLENTAAAYSLHTGIERPYFDDTDYMNVLLMVLREAIRKFWWRLTWFSDTAAQNVSAGGTITNGVDVAFFTILDGLWKQIMTQATANPAQRTATITENAGATYAAQTLNPDNVIGYLRSVVTGAPRLLRGQADAFILVTQSVYDAYDTALTDPCCTEASRTALINGNPTLTFKGIPVIPIIEWDIMIEEYENTGTALNNPHRILYTSRRVLGVGVDNVNSFDSLRIWNDYNTREVKVEAMGISDAELTNPAMLSLGI